MKRAGLRLAFLSKMTANYRREGAFDDVLSTDRVKAYKPHPRPCAMAVDAFASSPVRFCSLPSRDLVTFLTATAKLTHLSGKYL